MTTENNSPVCLDANDYESCVGLTDYRMAMSPTGISYPRCDGHYEARWETQERISRDYGVPLTYDSPSSWADEMEDY